MLAEAVEYSAIYWKVCSPLSFEVKNITHDPVISWGTGRTFLTLNFNSWGDLNDLNYKSKLESRAELDETEMKL